MRLLTRLLGMGTVQYQRSIIYPGIYCTATGQVCTVFT